MDDFLRIIKRTAFFKSLNADSKAKLLEKWPGLSGDQKKHVFGLAGFESFIANYVASIVEPVLSMAVKNEIKALSKTAEEITHRFEEKWLDNLQKKL